MKAWQKQDPEANAEAGKYDDPVPSRTYLLAWIEQHNAPVDLETVCRALKISEEAQIEGVRRRLIAMSRDGQLVSNRRGQFGMAAKMNLSVGRVRGHSDGHGFLKPEKGDSIWLPASQMQSCMDGDKVSVRTERGFKGRQEGFVVEVHERANQRLVGRFYQNHGIGYLIPENPRIRNEILIPAEFAGSAQDGEMVVIEMEHFPTRRKQGIGKVAEVLGKHMAPGMEIDVALRTYNIPHEFPVDVKQQARALSSEVEEADKEGRVDLRKRPFVTIDGEDAKDFDDAVLCTVRPGGGFKLFVAIADVSHYVQPNKPLDQEAYERATSVYFPGQVIPMLPEELSNGLCSLNPEVDRLAMVCEMTLDADGEIEDYKFYEGVIHSHARLTYTQVAAMLEDPDAPAATRFKERDKKLVRPLNSLNRLYEVLVAKRKVRGAIEFETQEPIIVFNEHRKIDQIDVRSRNVAHKIIEECMLAANTCAAKFLEGLKIPALYRVHEGPNEEKLDKLHSWLAALGLHLQGGFEPSPRDVQKLLKDTANRPDAEQIQTMVLRSMSQAVYQPENHGHFGLAYKAYAHFTSPIRRYPDLLVHRGIRAQVRSFRRSPNVKRVANTRKEQFEHNYPYTPSDMAQMGEHSSMCERRADEATRDVVNWLKCEFMQERIGEEFAGKVTAVRPFGLFVQLDEFFIDGMIHITGLGNDYFVFDEQRQMLLGERTRKVYRLGDEIKVQIARVDLDERQIDFAIVGVERRQGGKSAAKGAKPGSPAKKGHRKGGSPGDDFGKLEKPKRKRGSAAKKGKAAATSKKKTAGKKKAGKKKSK